VKQDNEGAGRTPEVGAGVAVVVDFWDCDETTDHLTHHEVDEAVEYMLDQMEPEEWPRALTVHAFARDEISAAARQHFAISAAERLLEDLDEEHGDPNGSDRTPQYAIDAARVLVDAVLEKYTVWSCHRVPAADEKVDVAAWVKEHAAHWLEKASVAGFVAARTAESP
jgi:hypothetical protein